MTAASRRLTPTPPPRNRAGTFDGLDKLFFDRAAAIESGELTAPPEAPSALPTRLKGLTERWQEQPLSHKVGFGAGVGAVLLASFLLFAPQAQPDPTGGGVPSPPAQSAAAPQGTSTTVPQSMVPARLAAPVETTDAKPGTARRRARAAKRAARLASTTEPTKQTNSAQTGLAYTNTAYTKTAQVGVAKTKATRTSRSGRSKAHVKPLDPFD